MRAGSEIVFKAYNEVISRREKDKPTIEPINKDKTQNEFS